jgi:hypothetical protein
VGTDEGKVRSNRLRRMAGRQGIALSKVNRRDPLAKDYDRWSLLDPDRDVVLSGLTIDQVERYLITGSAEG